MAEPHSPPFVRNQNGNPTPPGCRFGFLCNRSLRLQSLDLSAIIRHVLSSSTTTSERSRFGDLNLGIVCPMANEEASAVRFVEEVLRECTPAGFRSVVFFAILDHASKDRTRELLNGLQEQCPQLQVVWSPENKTVVDAYVRGYEEALSAGCDWILEIDAGFSHQPSDTPQFFDKRLSGRTTEQCASCL